MISNKTLRNDWFLILDYLKNCFCLYFKNREKYILKQIEKSDSKRFYNKYYVVVRDCLDALRSSAMPDNSKLSEFISLVP